MGERIRLTDPAPEVLALPRAQRIVHGKPVIGFVALDERLATKGALEAACAACSVRAQALRVLPRSRPGHEVLLRDGSIEGLAASLDALPAAVERILLELPSHDVLLLEGLAGLAHVKTALSFAVSDRPITDWPRDLRAMRGELDLVLTEPRPRTFEALARTLLVG